MPDLSKTDQIDSMNDETAQPGAQPQPLAPSAAPTPAQHQAATDAHASMLGKIYHGILGTLGGRSDVNYSRDENGKLVATTTPRAPGDQWKHIIAGALTGMAAGAEARRINPNAQGLTGLGLGAGATMQNEERLDDRRREIADKDFAAKQEAAMRKAQIADLTQRQTDSAWRLSRAQAEAQFQDSERENAFMKTISLDPSNRDLGVARNIDDLMQIRKDVPNILQEHARGNVLAIPHTNPETGKIDGMHFALVNPDWKERKLDQDQPLYRLMPGDKPGDGPKVDKQTVKAGTMTNGEYYMAQQASNAQFMSWYEKQYAESEEDKRARMREQGENYRAQKELDARIAIAQGRATRDDIKAHDKNYVLPARQVERSWEMMDSAYQEYETAKKAGKDLPTGAQSMVALSTHLSTTFGNVKGSRITNDMIQHHFHARSISDDARVAIQKLSNGEQISDAQWDAFHDLVKQSRDITWKEATLEANRKNIPVNFLPDDLQGMKDEGKEAPGGGTAQGGWGAQFNGAPHGGTP
jgi:hypothetical protein